MKLEKDNQKCSSWRLPPLGRAEMMLPAYVKTYNQIDLSGYIRNNLYFLASCETEQCKIIPYYKSKYHILFEEQTINFHHIMHDLYRVVGARK